MAHPTYSGDGRGGPGRRSALSFKHPVYLVQSSAGQGCAGLSQRGQWAPRHLSVMTTICLWTTGQSQRSGPCPCRRALRPRTRCDLPAGGPGRQGNTARNRTGAGAHHRVTGTAGPAPTPPRVEALDLGQGRTRAASSQTGGSRWGISVLFNPNVWIENKNRKQRIGVSRNPVLIVLKTPSGFLFRVGNERQLLGVIGLLASKPGRKPLLEGQALYLHFCSPVRPAGGCNLHAAWRGWARSSKEDTTQGRLTPEYLHAGSKRT